MNIRKLTRIKLIKKKWEGENRRPQANAF